MILGYLSRGDLCCRAMRVSKAWKGICRNRDLWRHLQFVKNFRQQSRLQSSMPRVFRPGVLNDIVHGCSQNNATSVTIDGLWDFGLYAPQLGAMLKALTRLKTLNISGHRGVTNLKVNNVLTSMNVPKFREYWKVICDFAPSTLVSIGLSGFNVGHYHATTRRGVFSAFEEEWLVGTSLAHSLQTLSLAEMMPLDVELVLVGTLCRNFFPKLEVLSLKGAPHSRADSNVMPHICLAGLVHFAPKLKDLVLDAYFGIYSPRNKPAFLEDKLLDIRRPISHGNSPGKPWTELQHLKFGCDFLAVDWIVTWPIWGWIPRSSSMRSLEYTVDGLGYARDLVKHLESQNSMEPASQGLDGLEHFLCHGPKTDTSSIIFFRAMEGNPLRILRPSIASGTLRSVDITYVDSGSGGQTQDCLDDIFGARKGMLHTLSCNRIMVDGCYYDNWERCLAWIGTFPNLEVVGLFPELDSSSKPLEKAWVVVTGLMKLRPDIKTIYTNALWGAARDAVLALAARNGVAIIEADRVPEPKLQFPPPAPWVPPPAEEEEAAGPAVLGAEATDQTA